MSVTNCLTPKLLLCFSLTLVFGCSEPAFDSTDVARLSVVNVAALAQLINEDETCGFESPSVIASEVIEGAVDTEGTQTRSVERCLIDLSLQPALWPSFACDTGAGVARGRAWFTAKRVLAGKVTGDPDDPLIPGGPEAVTFQLERVEFEGFEIARKDKAGSLVIEEGALSATVQVRLAAGARTLLCEEPTAHTRIEALKYEGASVRLTKLDTDRSFRVDQADLEAVTGRYGAEENVLSGTIMIDGLVAEIPPGTPLDTDYDPALFERRFACPENPDITQPVSYVCGGVSDLVAQNAARLTTLSIGRVAELIDDDTTCGFESPAVRAARVSDGAVGSRGTVTYTVDRCTLVLPADGRTRSDCHGEADEISGELVVSARKRVVGHVTGDSEDPVVPTLDSGAEIEISEIIFRNFSLTRGRRAITLHSGSARARVVPRLAVDRKDQACSVRSDVVRLSDVQFSGAARVKTISGEHEIQIGDATLSATRGAWMNEENSLSGTIQVDGSTHTIPIDLANAPFDPDYERGAFEAGWQCGEELQLPASFDCESFDARLAEAAARLSIQAFGALAQEVDENETCGFESSAVKSSARIAGDLGRDGATGLLSLGGRPCRLDFGAEPRALKRDCNAQQTFVSGSSVFTGTKSLRGYNTGNPDEPIVVTSTSSVELGLSLELSQLSFFEEARPKNRITVRSGTLKGNLRPLVAVDLDTGACSKPTDIAAFDAVTWAAPTDLSLTLEGKRFDVRIDAMELRAQSGNGGARENFLAGHVRLNGKDYAVPRTGDSRLDPDYDRARFESAFTCDPELEMPKSADECTFRKPLAVNTARLLMKSAYTLADFIGNEEDCGFKSLDNLEDPVRMIGREDAPGEAEWSAPRPERSAQGPCRYTRGLDQLFDRDCLGRARILGGNFDIRARRITRGIRASKAGVEYVNPTSPDGPGDFILDRVDVAPLRVYEVDPGDAVDDALTLERGTLSAWLNPIMGEDERDDFTYVVMTPVARFRELNLTQAVARVLLDKNTFLVNIESAQISGFSGAYRSEKNTISGTMTLDGDVIRFEGEPLLEDYDQRDFDARYACTENLVQVVDSTPR